MPEHETFDLDAAFARLEQDITTLSTAPGAGAAVSRARRRRRTRAGAVAAVAVLAVTGVAVGQGARHDSAIEPASSLPTPAVLDAAALSTATHGWTSAWSPASSQSAVVLTKEVLRCLDQAAVATQAAPDRGSGDLSFTAGQAASFATLEDFQEDTATAEAVWADLAQTIGQCSNATLSGQQAWDGGEALSYALSAPTGKTEHLWIARTGSTFGMLWVANAAEPVPGGDDRAVMTALVAALLSPKSYHDGASTSSSASISPSGSGSAPFLSASEFAHALGTWRSAWSATADAVGTDESPCGVQVSAGASSGHGASLGANGEQEIDGFETEGAARSAWQSAASALAACSSASYDVHTVPTTGEGSVTVAAGTGDGADVVWLVQSGTRLGYLTIPAGVTTPPDSVTRAVGDRLLLALGATAPAAASSTAP